MPSGDSSADPAAPHGTHPAVAAAERLADELLRPSAERVDREGVPRAHIDALAAAGLMDLPALPAAVARRVAEELAAADATTWFVWTQHHTPVRTLLRGDNDALRERRLGPLRSGAELAGVAFTHLRRPGPPAVTARRAGSGWRISGTIAWLTSWSLADVFLVGAQTGPDVVWFLDPLRGRPQVSAEQLGLAAMAGSATVTVRLDDLPISGDDVVLVEPVAQWREVDAARTADVSPAVLGVTAEAVRRLHAAGQPEAADGYAAALAGFRETADVLLDQTAAGDRLADRYALRAEAHALSVRATAALVAAGGGRSMLLDSPAQRLARVAMFLLVQGQTSTVRAETLRHL